MEGVLRGSRLAEAMVRRCVVQKSSRASSEVVKLMTRSKAERAPTRERLLGSRFMHWTMTSYVSWDMDGKTSNRDCLSREKSRNRGSASVGVVKGFREKRMFSRQMPMAQM